jgi:hypothetical protein
MSTALTNALAAIDAYPGDGSERDLLIRAKCRGLMHGYANRWDDSDWTALAVEKVYTADLVNPLTEAKSRTFQMAGKLDVFAMKNGRKFIIDHKTTSEDIEDVDAPYWHQLRVEGQVTHYMLLTWNERPDGAIWDVIRKPSISPKKLTKIERTGCVHERKYFGVNLSSETLTGLQTEERETLEMYEARLAHDCTVERPGRYFQRRSVPRLDREVLEYAEDLWQHSQDILASRKVERLPKNSGACMLYGSPCQFLGICSGFDTPDSDRWQQRESRHTELGEHGHMDALTHSRVRTFQTCRQKHRFTYELGIERQQEDREALYFGNVLHEGLRCYWETFLEVENVNDNSAATTAASAG